MDTRFSRTTTVMFAALASASLAALTGCAVPEAAPARPTRWVIFLDQSGSIAPRQRERWAGSAQAIVSRLQAGDAIEVYGVHDRTLDAGALFAGGAPLVGADPGFDELSTARRALAAVKRGAQGAIAQALAAHIQSRQTDILSAVDRIQPDADGRALAVVFFSDMQHTGSELDIERQVLEAGAMPSTIQRIAQEHRWHARTLGGARVWCVLGAQAAGDRPLRNDRRTLALFYSTLFQALGARLERFDTDLAQ